MEKIKASVDYETRTKFASSLSTSNVCLNWLEKKSDCVMQYEDKKLLEAGRQLIPLDNLLTKAKNCLSLNLDEQKISTKLRDYLLVELLNWFHEDFFTWIDQIPCRFCGGTDKTGENFCVEMVNNHTMVEKRFCCGNQIAFYRYNDVAQLMVTRKGRCGEFANAFTFLCRCLDFEARLIMTSYSFKNFGFDHVWTEVYSEHQNRWIHLDPSENVFDAPLMYECGWKRNIDYIFAFSCHDVQDVTWRYTSNHKQLLQKRKFCSESELVSAMFILKNKRQNKLSEQRKKLLDERCFMELIEFFNERKPTIDERKCRSSGSLEWRLSRGECDTSSNKGYVFHLTDLEVKIQQFNLRYSCVTDKYERYSNGFGKGNIEVITTYDSWNSCLYKSKNIFRKKERDWHKVYLARIPDSQQAEAVWRFDFNDHDLIVESYKFDFGQHTFHNGQVQVLFTSIDRKEKSISFETKSNNTLQNDIIGASAFEISVYLSGGQGDEAWQHAQLFRDDDTSKDFKFNLQIKLKKCT